MNKNISLKIKQFGQVFSSRSDGREAALSYYTYNLSDQNIHSLELDFTDVLIMTPSWLGEFIQTLNSKGITKFSYLNIDNITVKNSLEIIKSQI